MNKRSKKKVSDDLYITLGLLGRFGAVVWIVLAIILISLLEQYGWTEEIGGMIVSAVLLLSMPFSIVLTGLFSLLGAIWEWKGALCMVQSMHHQEMNPRKSWHAKDKRDMIIVGCIFILLGIAILLAWILPV